jgi:hypothetical protein
MRCGRLGVGRYPLHSLVAPLAAGAGSQRVFVVAAISQGLIEPQQIPPDRLHTDSPAAHLPYPHRLVSALGATNSVDFDDADLNQSASAPQRLSSVPAAEASHSRPPPAAIIATSRRCVAAEPMRRRIGGLRIAPPA